MRPMLVPSGGMALARSERTGGSEVHDLQDRRDAAIVGRVAGGDEAAFADLFRSYGGAALGLAVRVLGDRPLAEEVVQDVFLSIWRSADRFDGARGSARSWILTQVHHRAVDSVRREEAERRRNTVAAAPTRSDPTPDDVVEEDWLRARRDRVRAALGGLPPEQRDVLELAYLGGKSQTEVAAAMGLPLGTVKSRTLAGMKKMRAVLAGGDQV